MNKKSLFCTSTVALLAVSAASHAAVTVTYDFDNSANRALAAETGADAGSIAANDFGFFSTSEEGSSGDDSGISSSGNAFIRPDSTGNDTAAALADDDYFSFTLNVTSSDTFRIDSLTFDFGGNSGSGTNSAAFTSNVLVQSSAGGFGTGNPTLTVTPSSVFVPDTDSLTLVNGDVDVSGLTFDTANPITFQIRFHDDTNAVSTVNRVDNVVVNASIVPEPSAAFLGVIGALCFLLRRR